MEIENTVGNDRLYSIEEASRRLSVSQFTTRRLIKAKHISAVRVGKRVLVRGTELERVVVEGCGKQVEVPHKEKRRGSGNGRLRSERQLG
jgi:excisionase family DNA binding protein